jgi:hypothetical protein
MADNEKEVSKFEKIWAIVRGIEAVLLLAFGIYAMIAGIKGNPDNNAGVYKPIIIVFGIFLFLDGIIRLIKYYFEPIQATAVGDDFISSVFEMTIGCLLWIPNGQITDDIVSLFSETLVLFLAILCFVLAFIFIMGPTIGIIEKKRKMATAITEYVCAAAFIAAGIVIIHYNKSGNIGAVLLQIVVTLIGIDLVAFGLYALVTAFLPFRHAMPKKVKPETVKPDESKTVDAEFTEKKPEETKPEEAPVQDSKQIKDDNTAGKIEDKPEDK